MINIAICDDNHDDIMLIQNYVKEFMDNSKIGYSIVLCTSGEELLQTKILINILFLDISMGKGMNGILVGKNIKKFNNEVKIIYITNFSKYWKEAVNSVHAFAYLEKPILKKNLELQIEEALHLLREYKKERQSMSFKVIEIVDGILKTNIKKFDLDEIYYFEYINRKIRIHTICGEYYFIGQMKDLTEKMNKYNFESCHQSFLVNLVYVQRVKGYDLYLCNGEKLPISQKKSAKFRMKLNKFIQYNI